MSLMIVGALWMQRFVQSGQAGEQVKSLLGYFCCVGGEEVTFCQLDSEELDALHPNHHLSTDDEGATGGPAVTEARHHLLLSARIECQGVRPAPSCLSLHLNLLCAASSIFLS